MGFDTASVALHYDTLDHFYREIWGEHVHHGLFGPAARTKEQAVIALIDRLVLGLKLRSGQTVCDIGCGYGATLAHLASTYQVQGMGLTISGKQHEIASARNVAGVSFKLQDWLANDLPSESFDAALAIESSEHMGDFDLFLRQAKRVLKPGGRLGMAVWLRNPGTPSILDRWLNDAVVQEGRLANVFATDELISRVAKEFRIVSFEDVTKRVRKTWTYCAREIFVGVTRKQEYRDFLFRSSKQDRVFALTVLRIATAYYLGSMSYSLLVAEKAD